MRLSAAFAAFVPTLAVSAATITVLVGDGGQLAYNPTSATANVGDVVAFEFRAKNHTVTQSTFANPCQVMTTPQQGIDSGFQAVAANATSFPQWSFTVNNASAPLWFFCRQTGHCQQGMVFALNPTASKTFAQFQANAEGKSSSASAGSAASTQASGAGASSGGTPTGSASASPTHSNSALRKGGSAASILALVGLLAGVTL